MPLPEKLTAKSLAGIKFRYAEKKEVVEDGRRKTQWVGKERAAALADVLAARVLDEKTASVVLGDGSRHVVPLG